MYPDDRVLVGVIRRRRDLHIAQDARWYRIPQRQMPHGVYAEYIAFFLSSGVFQKGCPGGIYYYGARTGLELAYRRDLLPGEPDHPRANEVYYKVQLGELHLKTPPILNPTRRTISFVYTTWDRFTNATEISDLYSRADEYVDRATHVLRVYRSR